MTPIRKIGSLLINVTSKALVISSKPSIINGICSFSIKLVNIANRSVTVNLIDYED